VSAARARLAAALAVAGALALAQVATAHCDTRQGPVVADARLALEQGSIEPVLKWLRPESEAEVREAFRRALAVRGLGAEARELADDSFFETLVRLHRESENAPYTGLKDEAPDEVIQAADAALAAGTPGALAHQLASAAEAGIRERFARAVAARAHREQSVAAGREYVAAYVELTHYLERLDAAIAGGAAHGSPVPDELHEHP